MLRLPAHGPTLSSRVPAASCVPSPRVVPAANSVASCGSRAACGTCPPVLPPTLPHVSSNVKNGTVGNVYRVFCQVKLRLFRVILWPVTLPRKLVTSDRPGTWALIDALAVTSPPKPTPPVTLNRQPP